MSTEEEMSKSGRALGKIGGPARARSLSPERRREIAAKANASKKCYAGIPKAVNEGILTIGSFNLPCAVLEDGTRLITQTAFIKALGKSGKQGGVQKSIYISNLPVFLDYVGLKPLITTEIENTCTPIKFIPKNSGGIAYGYKADLLVDVCEVYLKARDCGFLAHNQKHIAERCDIIMRSLAKVGITALIDESTGYQYDRDRDALQKLLGEYISEELLPWTRKFPQTFFEQLKRIYGCEDLKGNPSHFGHFINKYVYDKLAPGVLDELKRVNPVLESGNRSARHHQWLTDKTGAVALEKKIVEVTTLMTISGSKDDFDRILEMHRAAKELQKEKEEKRRMAKLEQAQENSTMEKKRTRDCL